MFLGIWLLVVSSMAVDRSKFKTCEDASFCRRFCKFISADERAKVIVSNDIIQSKPGVFKVLMKRECEVVETLSLTLTFYDAGMLRLTVDDALPVRARYRVPEGDVVVDELKLREGISYVTNGGMTKFTDSNDERGISVVLNHSLFDLQLFWGEELVQSVNTRNFFNFERHRKIHGDACSGEVEWDSLSSVFRLFSGNMVSPVLDAACYPEADVVGCWGEKFRGFFDPKPFGPAGVGVDISFHGHVTNLFGLPEKTLSFALPESRILRFFNLDVFQYEIDSEMSLYGNVPLVIALQKDSTSGVLWLNPSETYFSFDRSLANSANTWWTSESGVLDIVLFPGPDHKTVIKQYHVLTGLPAMPPSFALGYHQSRWNYFSEAEVEDISEKFDRYEIPLDVIWLDIEHTDKKKYLTWDGHNFANPIEMQSKLFDSGRKLVTIVDPHIKVERGYRIYDELLSLDGFVKRKDGSVFEGVCWPGKSSYADFTSSRIRDIWGDLFSLDSYVGSTMNLHIWNDMNEPSVFDGPELTFPGSLIHENGVEHRDLHNLYGSYYHRATFKGLLKRSQGRERPFVLSRSFFAGSHRYGPVWTGDNKADWSHLKISLPMLLSMSITGIGFAGADVGGFFGHPTSELYIRWHQFAAAAYPFYRTHSHLDSPKREPWTFDNQTLSLVSQAIQMRYQMLPYWYTLFGKHALNGDLILRPMWWDFGFETATHEGMSEQVMVGESILVKLIAESIDNIQQASVYLPKGDWYSYHPVTIDGSSHRVMYQMIEDGFRQFDLDMNHIPIFVRAGSIIPLKLRKRRSSTLMKGDPLTLRVFVMPGTGNARGEAYFDDESTTEHERGIYSLMVFNFESNTLTASSSSSIGYRGPLIERIEFVGLELDYAAWLVVGTERRSLDVYYDASSGAFVIKKPDVVATDTVWSIELEEIQSRLES